jgi:hypothetical protein
MERRRVAIDVAKTARLWQAQRRVRECFRKADLFEILWTVFAPLTFCQHAFSSHDLRDFAVQGGTFYGNNLMDVDNPQAVQPGDWVYVEQGNLRMFMAYMFPRIQLPFVLVTLGLFLNVWDSPSPTPWDHALLPPNLRECIESDKILLWVTKNAPAVHPKILSVPIGVCPTVLVEYAAAFAQRGRQRRSDVVHVSLAQNGPDRSHLPVLPRQSAAEQFGMFATARACLSPTGWRADCFRHLECIGLGCTPIVNTHAHNMDVAPLLQDIYGDSILLVARNDLPAWIGKPATVPAPDRSLVLVDTWIQKIHERLKTKSSFPQHEANAL